MKKLLAIAALATLLTGCNATQNALVSGMVADTSTGTSNFHRNEATILSHAPYAMNVDEILSLDTMQQQTMLILCRPPVPPPLPSLLKPTLPPIH